MNVATIIDHAIARSSRPFTFAGDGILRQQLNRPDRRLAKAAGNIEDIIRLAKA
jgi:hypothetical protein